MLFNWLLNYIDAVWYSLVYELYSSTRLVSPRKVTHTLFLHILHLFVSKIRTVQCRNRRDAYVSCRPSDSFCFLACCRDFVSIWIGDCNSLFTCFDGFKVDESTVGVVESETYHFTRFLSGVGSVGIILRAAGYKLYNMFSSVQFIK